MSQHKVVLLLGSNLGEQKKNVELALKMINEITFHKPANI